MMVWIFAGLTLSAALTATLVQNMKLSILALWVAGLGVGAMYLTMEAEYLAIVQWIVSTLLTITFIFFAVMFGEYGRSERKRTRSESILAVISVVLGLGFAGIIGIGTHELSRDHSAIENVTDFTNSATDLKVLGTLLIEKNFLSMEVLALTLFLVLVGGGAIARFEREDPS